MPRVLEPAPLFGPYGPDIVWVLPPRGPGEEAVVLAEQPALTYCRPHPIPKGGAPEPWLDVCPQCIARHFAMPYRIVKIAPPVPSEPYPCGCTDVTTRYHHHTPRKTAHA